MRSTNTTLNQHRSCQAFSKHPRALSVEVRLVMIISPGLERERGGTIFKTLMGNKYLRDLIESHPHLWKPIIPFSPISSHSSPLGAFLNIQKIDIFSFFSKICSHQPPGCVPFKKIVMHAKLVLVFCKKSSEPWKKGRAEQANDGNSIDHYCACKKDKFPHKNSFALCMMGKQGGSRINQI